MSAPWEGAADAVAARTLEGVAVAGLAPRPGRGRAVEPSRLACFPLLSPKAARGGAGSGFGAPEIKAGRGFSAGTSASNDDRDRSEGRIGPSRARGRGDPQLEFRLRAAVPRACVLARCGGRGKRSAACLADRRRSADGRALFDLILDQIRHDLVAGPQRWHRRGPRRRYSGHHV